MEGVGSVLKVEQWRIDSTRAQRDAEEHYRNVMLARRLALQERDENRRLVKEAKMKWISDELDPYMAKDWSKQLKKMKEYGEFVVMDRRWLGLGSVSGYHVKEKKKKKEENKGFLKMLQNVLSCIKL